MEQNVMKLMARQAKQRLKGQECTPNQKYCVLTTNTNVKIMVKSKKEIAFDEKIKDVAKEDSLTPLHKLIDIKFYKSLNNNQKQRYLLNVAERYRSCKQELLQSKEVV